MPKKYRAALAAIRGLDVKALQNGLLQPNVLVVPKIAPPTETKYEFVKNCWLEYLTLLGVESPESTIQQGAIQPTTQTLKSFIAWWARATQGRLSEYPTLRTCLLTWKNFQGMFDRYTGKKIDKVVVDDVRGYISGPLCQELGIKHELRPQGYADNVDLEILINFLWSRDYHDYKHDRYRVQLALLILLFFYTGARCGSFTGTTEYKDLNFTYKNIEVVISSFNSQPTIYLRVNQDSMKGKKGTLQFVDVILHERKIMGQCPVAVFLALAFADNAFQDISTPEQLVSLRPQGRRHVTIAWKTEMRDVPIFKQWISRRNQMGTKSFSRQQFERSLAELSLRAGYENSIKPHFIRRGVANRVDKHATAAERNHLLGHHNSSVYQKHYISSISNVDVQGAILDGKTRDDHIQVFRRISQYDNPHDRLSLEKRMDVLHSPDLKILKEQISENLQDETTIRILKRKYWSLKQKALGNALQKEKDEWFQKWASREIARQLNTDMGRNGDNMALDRVGYNSVKVSVLRRLCPHRRLIADACTLGGMDLWTDQSILHSLIQLFSKDSRIRYYPGEFPIEGKCPKCYKDIESMGSYYRPRHIHECFQKSIRSLKEFSEYCYSHEQWFTDSTEWDDHRCAHLLNMDIFCGIVKFRGIIGRAGRCPFCMSHFPEGSPAERFREFPTSEGFTHHLRNHIDQIRDYNEPVTCPHASCNQACSSTAKLLCHFYDIHGIDEAEGLLENLKKPTNKPPAGILEQSAIPSAIHHRFFSYQDPMTSAIATNPPDSTHDDNQPAAPPISPTPSPANSSSSLPKKGRKRKARESNQVRPRKQSKYQLNVIGESKVLQTGQLCGGREYLCPTFTLPRYGTDLFMIAMNLRRLLRYTTNCSLYGGLSDPSPTLVAEGAVRYLKAQKLLPEKYRPRNVLLVKAYDMFQKFGHRVVLGGVPNLDDYYEIYGNVVDITPGSSSSLSTPETTCSNLSGLVPTPPPMEEATLPEIGARETKKPKSQRQKKLSPSEEMENRNRAIRLHTGYVRNSTTVITID